MLIYDISPDLGVLYICTLGLPCSQPWNRRCKSPQRPQPKATISKSHYLVYQFRHLQLPTFQILGEIDMRAKMKISNTLGAADHTYGFFLFVSVVVFTKPQLRTQEIEGLWMAKSIWEIATGQAVEAMCDRGNLESRLVGTTRACDCFSPP